MDDETILQLLCEFVVGADIQNLISVNYAAEISMGPVAFDP